MDCYVKISDWGRAWKKIVGHLSRGDAVLLVVYGPTRGFVEYLEAVGAEYDVTDGTLYALFRGVPVWEWTRPPGRSYTVCAASAAEAGEQGLRGLAEKHLNGNYRVVVAEPIYSLRTRYMPLMTIVIAEDQLPPRFWEYIAEEVSYEAKTALRELTGADADIDTIGVYIRAEDLECLRKYGVDDSYACNYEEYAVVKFDNGYGFVVHGSTGVDEYGRKYVFIDSDIIEEMFGDYDEWLKFVKAVEYPVAVAFAGGIYALATLFASDANLREYLYDPQRLEDLEFELIKWVKIAL